MVLVVFVLLVPFLFFICEACCLSLTLCVLVTMVFQKADQKTMDQVQTILKGLIKPNEKIVMELKVRKAHLFALLSSSSLCVVVGFLFLVACSLCLLWSRA